MRHTIEGQRDIVGLGRFFPLVLLGSLIMNVACGGSQPRVEANGEVLLGETRSDGVVVFRGIPFAKPPIGDLRWRPPEPVTPRDGAQDAMAFGSVCMQTGGSLSYFSRIADILGEELAPDTPPESEDCLYLNVWTPDLDPDAKLPVLVWIHGGGNAGGAGSADTYTASDLPGRGVVLVTLNYRLGPLGFLAHPALSVESGIGASGNYGLLDQVAALQWVNHHIAAFGGDPDLVTVFGESAGGSDVMHLMAAERARGLFQRAIIQSGGGFLPLAALAVGEEQGVAIAEQLGIEDPSSAEALAQMRRTSAVDLIALGSGANTIVDGLLLTESTEAVFAGGRQAPVPLIIGTNRNEGNIEFAIQDRIDRLRATEDPAQASLVRSLLDLYPSEESWGVDRPSFFADMIFTCQARALARRHAKAGYPTFRYFLARELPGDGGKQLGAFHAMDLLYLFSGSHESWLLFEATDADIAEAFREAWVGFAKTGTPAPEAATWPAWTAASDPHLVLDETIFVGHGVRTEECDAMDPVVGWIDG